MKVVKQGSQFAVRLNENPSTGYTWQISVTSGLKVESEYFIPGSKILGGANTHIWIIKATEKGMQQIKEETERLKSGLPCRYSNFLCDCPPTQFCHHLSQGASVPTHR